MITVPADVILIPLIAAAACVLPIGRLARPLAILSGLAAAGTAGASAWFGVGDPGDPFASVLIVLTGLLFAAGAAAARDVASPRSYFALWSLLQAAVASTLVATELVSFVSSWEATVIPLGLLLWLWGGPDRRRVTLRLAVMWLTGDALLLTGVVALGIGANTFVFGSLAGYRLAEASQVAFAILFLAAFAMRLPLFPFHSWLPRACVAAPPPVAIVLCAVTPALAVYGIARLCLRFFPLGMADLGPYLAGLAAVGSLYAALLATRQRDTRAFVAYASLSQVQLIATGAFAGSADRVAGPLLAAVSHGIVIAALVILVTALAERSGSFSLEPSGVARAAPVLVSLLVVATFAAIGGPADLLVLAAVYASSPGVGVVATLVVVASGAYAAIFLRAIFGGPDVPPGRDLGWAERAPALALVALVLALIVAPRVVTDLVDRPLPAITRDAR